MGFLERQSKENHSWIMGDGSGMFVLDNRCKIKLLTKGIHFICDRCGFSTRFCICKTDLPKSIISQRVYRVRIKTRRFLLVVHHSHLYPNGMIPFLANIPKDWYSIGPMLEHQVLQHKKKASFLER